MLWKAGTGTRGLYMVDGQSANLSEAVTSQRSGIVLHWGGGTDANDYHSGNNNCYAFVPKHHVVDPNGWIGPGVCCGLWASTSMGHIGSKYVYVYDTRIDGYETNDSNGVSASGVEFDSDYWVLTEVLGV